MERKLEWLQNKMADIGDSITKVEELFQEFEEFEQQAQVRFTWLLVPLTMHWL